MTRADCTSCPAHSVTQTGNVADCACEPGYTGPDGGECSVCPAGKYKPTNGNSECTDCAQGKYVNSTGEISEASCADCPANTYAKAGSAFCTCQEGYTGPDATHLSTFTVTVHNLGGGNVLAVDGVNKPAIGLVRPGVYTFIQSDASNAEHQLAFKDGTGASYATGVATTGTPGTAGAQTVITLAHDAPDNLRYHCVAHGDQMGNTIRVTPCLACDAGKYKDTNGTAPCTQCPPGKFSGAQGATASDTCSDCPGNQSSLPASTNQSDCGCLLGYYDQSVGHILHYGAPGTVSPGWCLDVNECINKSHCSREHMNCVNEPGSFNCACNTGYERVIMDQDEPQLEVFACANINECERVEYQTCHESAYCVDTDGSFTCTCFLGMSGDGIVEENGGTECFEYNGGFCENSTLNDCHVHADCSYDIQIAPGSFICTCNMGFVDASPGTGGWGTNCEDADECRLTGSGCYQYQPTLSLSLCVGSGEAQASPAACSPNALCSNTVGSFTCTCNIGYAGDGTVCVGCAPGTYMAAAGNNGSCLECSPNTYQNASGASNCLDCAENTISAAASRNHSDCLCKIAFSGPNGGACSACQAGTYKSIVGSSVCAPCSAFSDSPRQSSLETNCTCNRGETDPGNVPAL